MDAPTTNPQPPPAAIQPEPKRPARGAAALLLLGAAFVLYCVVAPEGAQAAWNEIERIIGLKSEPLAASPARLSGHILEELGSLPAQKQAEMLMQRAVNHYAGAIEEIDARVGGWCGQIHMTPEFEGLLRAAINSNDLRVRAAAIEIYLAAYNLAKMPESSIALRQRILEEPPARPWALWMLGALGNRGVDSGAAFETLLDYLKDRDEETRYWAVEGLALLGSDATIQPLLDTFHNDPSLRVRERAACSLAQSGMLTKEQRMTAVPALIDFAGDVSLDATTRHWVYQALQDITGARLGEDAASWRNWWNERAALAPRTRPAACRGEARRYLSRSITLRRPGIAALHTPA